MTLSEVWGFLVSRNQFIDYRTIVAPCFMCEAGVAGLLAKAAEGDLTEPGVAWYREVHNSKVGDLTLVFRVIEATAENTGIEGEGTLKDSFGREIHLIEGIVQRDIVPETFVNQETLDEVHEQLTGHYQEFWNETSSKSAVPSKSFNLSSEGVKVEYKFLKEYLIGTKIQIPISKGTSAKPDIILEPTQTYKKSWSTDYRGEIISVVCSTNGKVQAWRYDRKVMIMDIKTRQAETLFSARKVIGDSPAPLVISGDGRFVATAMIETADVNIVKVWEVSTKKEKSFSGHQASIWGRIKAVAITLNGETIISGGEDRVIPVWDTESGGKLGDFPEHSSPVTYIAISPSQEIVASSDTLGLIKIWKLRSRQSIYTIEAHPMPVTSLAFSPDGQLFASASRDYSIKLWNVKDGKEIFTLGQHLASINSIAFSSDGKLIASGADDCLIKIWDVSQRKEISVLRGHTREVTSVTFIPQQTTLVSGSKDCTIKYWEF